MGRPASEVVVSVSIEGGTIRREHTLVRASPSGSGDALRTALLQSQVGLVENLQSSGANPRTTERFSPDFQVCLPYRGLFIWHVGHDDVVCDANQAVFVRGGESFSLSQPGSSGYAELVITPERALLEELADGAAASLSRHPLFTRRSRRVGFDFQRRRAAFLHAVRSADANGLALDECTVALLRGALEIDAPAADPRGATRRLIRCTKEFLEANLSNAIRLGDIARAVGASPAYLTNVFRRVEGVPLHGYLTQLRLARALVELPHSSDLTTLALSLGFSSHSHFTAAFRRAFGCTPSRCRASLSASRPGRYRPGPAARVPAVGARGRSRTAMR
jgi:AraC family transcriptional regulator